jgi:formylglycine-generating enzyme required for sulfatase activity
VTSRYQQFVDAGGYTEQRWKHPFVTPDGVLGWAEAMKRLVDKTGQPGPATWANGRYPEGKEEHPVCGVSWYEAAAYAEYAGKSLPTIHHWRLAASMDACV